MPKNNYPSVAADDLPAEFVSDSISSLQALASLGKITGKPEQDIRYAGARETGVITKGDK